MKLQGLDQLLADGHEGIQTGHRVLKDHRDITTADGPQFALAKRKQVSAFKESGATIDATRR